MVAGTPGARDLLDDEHSPQLLAASRQFLSADQGIAEIARQKRLMARLKETATELAALYKALDLDVLTARTAAGAMHERYDTARKQLVASARTAYTSGQPTTDDGTAAGLAAAVARLGDGSTRADIRVGDLTVRRDTVRAEFERTAARYHEAERRLDDANKRLAALAAQRETALAAVRAARGSDLALNQARLAESGQLGAQIRAASLAVERSGRTVQGTGEFAKPTAGHVTSPFGMRFHPILHYTKLHTGTDFAGGDPAVLAADDGRVIMTVVSEAYGNFTVIDHGVIDGKRVTTAYAHQAQFLVREGQQVRRGEQIGIIGSTGYSTGPHLHFEVRENGTVVDPMTWLAGR
jgi:murein DD-endopeptidase MepM/ murein hydrolase activator NlpD